MTLNCGITHNQNIQLLYELSTFLRFKKGPIFYSRLNPRNNDAIAFRHKIKHPPLRGEIMRLALGHIKAHNIANFLKIA